MARKSTTRRHSSPRDSDYALAQSAQKIWLAGLGAFERTKSEGPKMFNVLVQQGRSLSDRARGAADLALKTVRDGASGAPGHFDKLEQVFEDRVSKTLGRLGVLTRGEVSDLSKQVGELTESVRSLLAQSRGRAGGAAKKGAKRGAAKKGAKRGAKHATSAMRAKQSRTKKRKA